MTDNITLPREVVEKAVKAFENGCPPTCENGMIDSGGFHPWGQPALVPCPACLAFEHLRTALAAEQPKHPGYIIGSHWLETAYSRICAGEAEADVLRDIGLVREEAFLTGVARLKAENEALRRDAERLREELKEDTGVIAVWRGRTERAEAENERLREALKLALNSHGRMLMSDPPQDAWKFNRVDEVIVAALRREDEK